MKPQMDEAVAWITAVTGEEIEGTFDEQGLRVHASFLSRRETMSRLTMMRTLYRWSTQMRAMARACENAV